MIKHVNSHITQSSSTIHSRGMFSPCRILLVCFCLMCSWPAAADTSSSQQLVDQQLVAILKKTVAEADSFEDKFDAQVWLMSKSENLKRFIPDSTQRMTLLRKIHRAATHAGLSPEVVLGLIQIESSFNPYAISRSGAQGLMQVMSFWKKEIGRPDDNLTDVDTNLRYGCTILKYYLDMEKGKLTPALARYNGSYGKTVYPEKVLLAWEGWR